MQLKVFPSNSLVLLTPTHGENISVLSCQSDWQ